MTAERAARLFVIGLALGVPLAAFAARGMAPRGVELRAAVSEESGWTPGNLQLKAGETLTVRLTSDDVLHGFAIGQSAAPALDVKPGEWTETTLTFGAPGKYTFYCTRWCGPNHWRMRGTIEVTGDAPAPSPAPPPLYVTLGLDLDAPHPADAIPATRPAPERGAPLAGRLPAAYVAPDYFRAHSPAQIFAALRADPAMREVADSGVWDLTAFIWRANNPPAPLAEARQLFAANCAACHGETGRGDGVMAGQLRTTDFNDDTKKPVNFTAPDLLGASPALLQGKIIRGGMGTGMPYWGPIFTDAQTWALAGYLYSFQFETEVHE